jgi:hypothetical protein
MIGIRLQGQLGNQLFQIAFIRLASKILDESYAIIDDKAYGCLVDKYFKLRIWERKYFRRLITKFFYLVKRETFEFNNWQETDKVLSLLKPGVVYKGFFQSENFFRSTTNKNSFIIKKRFRKTFNRKYGEVFKKYKIVVIHVRLKDYFEIGDDKLGGKGLQLPFTYYSQAINEIEIDKNTRVIVISDDPEFVRENFILDVPYSVETNHFIIDLLLLINANIVILSNSSFSWWGAYLNKSEDLKVIAPKYWMGFKVQKNYPVEIIPDNWSTVCVP